MLLAHPDDPSLLGPGPDGVPLMMALGASSLIGGVPIADSTTGDRVLTLARQPASGPFGVAILGLAEELGRHLVRRSGSTGCSAAGPRSPRRCRRA